MKITKRQLKRIITEEIDLKERMNQREMHNLQTGLRRAVVNFADEYMMTMGMNPAEAADRQRVRRAIDDIVGAVVS